MFTKKCQQCDNLIVEQYQSQMAYRRHCSRICLAASKRARALTSRQPTASPNEIRLSNGLIALVSDEDVEWANSFSWTANRTRGYAHNPGAGKPRRPIKMHRAIMSRALGRTLSPNESVDHRNGNVRDNRRDNLRLATHSQNMCNRAASSGKRYKGVYRTHNGKYTALICIEGNRIHLGTFMDELEAAYMYDQFALVLHGDFCRTNVI